MKRLWMVLLLAARGFPDAGVLIPSNEEQPNPARLALEEMAIDVKLDNGYAKVLIRQIFANKTGEILEGNYVFALPARALLSDFAVWDGDVRIPGVILERRRAEELYADIRAQAVDPGLLQMGERDASQARRTAIFSAKVAPIPAWGYKRIEIEYRERLAVERLESLFAIPLRPDAYRAQTAGRLWITLDVTSETPLETFDIASKAYAVRVAEKTANKARVTYEARNVPLSEDFAVRYRLAAARDALQVAAYRDAAGDGFFEAAALLANAAPAASLARAASAARGAPRTVIVLFDASLSMQWEKLERSYQALEAVLRSLGPGDKCNVVLFNSTPQRFRPSPEPATPAAVDQALAFVRAGHLRGGTNLRAALEDALAQSGGPETYLVLLGDLGATEGTVANAKLQQWYAGAWQKNKPRTYVFAIGDDANLPLARTLARQGGLMEWVRSTEPADFKLKAFVSKIGDRPVEGLNLTTEPAGNFSLVYPLEEAVFAGSLQRWVGRYAKPGAAAFTVKQLRTSVNLPAQATEHEYLPRTWAKARVDALLEKIDREGEDAASIDEIIRLSRKYKFVTPYTSFLAAPRSLLRPRLIRPGDPVLRVRTDPAIVSVVAVFPFGLTKPLRYLASEEVWQTRFLAPADLPDGTHSVRLLLRDRQGRVYQEAKTFVIASQAPVVNVKLAKASFRRGETIELRAFASQSARTITARLYGAPPAVLRWNAAAKASTGSLVVPDALPAGRYRITVTAEDFAHNIASQEVTIDVTP